MTLAIDPRLLTWLALACIAGFVIWLLVVGAILLWIHRRPSGHNVLPLRRRRPPQGYSDPRYDPRIFRSKR